PYPTADGGTIRADLTLPAESPQPVPAIVLAYDHLYAREYWELDFLAQYLASQGYAVLTSDYRGSRYRDWVEQGGLAGWQQGADDLTAAALWLRDTDIADPRQICVVAWGYAAYPALTSAEGDGPYRCAVSIAGVTNPAADAVTAGVVRHLGDNMAAMQ